MNAMTTLRDKVHEIADNWMIPRLAAIAVARVVAEHCANAACGVAASDSGLRTQARIIAAIRKEAENLK